MIRNNLEGALIDVNRFINIDSDRQEYTGHFASLKHQLFAQLRKTQPFGYLFNGWLLAGSYADNLKVKLPDEFDIIFHITFPENHLIDVEADPNLPGNVLLNFGRVLKKISNEKQHKLNLRCLKKWFNECNYLMVDKLQSYIESCFTTVLRDMAYNIRVDDKVATLKYKKTGPAHTIYVVGANSNMKYSVDFVPGILLSKSQSVCPTNKSQWEAIPKPHRCNPRACISFRSSFSCEEKNILKSKLNLKNALRMMKKFRDSHQNMNKMKSYFIKTLFLWKNKNESDNYWKSPLQEIIIDMFQAMEKSLTVEELPFFWDSRLNLYDCIYSPSLLREMLKCVKGARQTLEQAARGLNPILQKRVYCIFLTLSERQALENDAMERNFPKISKDDIFNKLQPLESDTNSYPRKIENEDTSPKTEKSKSHCIIL